MLKLTGYCCEVLGVQSICSINDLTINNKNNLIDSLNNIQPFSVCVLEALPLLTLETSLKMTPTVDNSVELIAEATVFSGQLYI